MLKRGIEGLAGAALLVVLLALLFPTVAQAQEEGGAAAPQEAVVVSPGDTLWSISEEHLGPGATPQQIAREVERIYALNQDEIGPDPNLIFSDQELSLPGAGGSSADKPSTKKTAQAATNGAAEGERSAKGQASDQRANLPKVPASAAVPAVDSLTSDTPLSVVAFAVRSAATAPHETLAEARTTANGRRLLGWGTIALTLLVCALIAWKLPMRRSLGDEREVWGIYPSYQGRYYAYSGVRERRNYASPHTYDVRTVLSANGAASSDSARDIPRTRQIVDAKFGDIDASQQWEIGEPLRRAAGSIPLEPGPSRSHALSEAKRLAQEALATLSFLEQRRQLTAKELRQARAIQRFLAAVEEEEAVYQGYQGPSANGSKAEATAKENGASRVGPQRIIRKRRQERPLPHNKRRGKSAATEVHSAEARRLLRKAVLRTRARKPRRSGRIKTTRRIAGVGGR
jgi:LysM repeat protein